MSSKDDKVNWNKFINDLLRPENRKLLFIYVIISGIILIVMLNFLASFFILIAIFGFAFGYPITRKIFKKRSL